MTKKQLDTESRILSAAEAEFLQNGYHGSRMQSIAERAQINKAMLHYYFKSKDALFEHIFVEKSKEFFPKMQEILTAEAHVIEKLDVFVENYIATMLKHPYVPFFMVMVAGANPEIFNRVKIAFPVQFAKSIEEAVAQGKIKAVHPEQFITSVMGMCALPFIAKTVICNVFQYEEEAYAALMQCRAEEVKTYIRAILKLENE